MLMVLPLGSSNLSMVLMSIIMMIPHVTINNKMKVTNKPANIGAEKKAFCTSGSLNFTLPVDADDIHG